MTRERTPKKGEVWTDESGTPYTCCDDEPDDLGCYGWAWPVRLHTGTLAYKGYFRPHIMTPPPDNGAGHD